MRKRCYYCNGRFGLIRYRHGMRHFCSNQHGKACKSRFIHELTFKVQTQRRWYGWLST